MTEQEAQPERDYRTCPVRKGKPRVALEVCKYCRWKTYAICKREEANDSR
jgi:hypothetical protein